MNHFTRVLSILLIAVFVSPAFGGGSAPLIDIDLEPGERGESFNARTIPFNDLDGSGANGNGWELRFTFTGDEQLLFTDSGSDGFDAIIRIEYSEVPTGAPSGQSSWIANFETYEVFANPALSGITLSGSTVVYTLRFEPSPGDPAFNRFRANISDVLIPGATISSASVEFVASGPGGSFEVTSPQAPGPIGIDSFTGVVSPAFPLVDTSVGASGGQINETNVPGSAAYQRSTNVRLTSGTSITGDVNISSGQAEFTVAPASTGTFLLVYQMGLYDFLQGGVNNALSVEVAGLSSVEISMSQLFGDPVGVTVPVVNGRAVVALDLMAFDAPLPPDFDFTRVTTVRINPPTEVAEGTYTISKVEVTDASTFFMTPRFQEWAGSYGLVSGGNDRYQDDPNNDGIRNISHFAFDTNPLTAGGGSEGKRRLAGSLIGGEEYLTLTFPVRRGASFSGSPGMQATIDGIVYTIEASADFQASRDQEIVEVLPALDDGLPSLRDIDGDGTSDWEYRTFRLGTSISTADSGFISLGLSEAP